MHTYPMRLFLHHMLTHQTFTKLKAPDPCAQLFDRERFLITDKQTESVCRQTHRQTHRQMHRRMTDGRFQRLIAWTSDPPCNIQLQTSFVKAKASFTYPMCGCVGCLYTCTKNSNTTCTDNGAISQTYYLPCFAVDKKAWLGRWQPCLHFV